MFEGEMIFDVNSFLVLGYFVGRLNSNYMNYYLVVGLGVWEEVKYFSFFSF